MSMRAVSIGLVVGGLLLASAAAEAQVTQIKPRVMIMLDTSGSMTEHLTKANNVVCANNGACAGSGACTGNTACVCDNGACYVQSRADGSTVYRDAVMTRGQSANGSDGLYVGVEATAGALTCPSAAGPFDGSASRMFNGKAAITNVINGSGDIDWGLERYTGFDCPLVETFTARVC